MDKYEAAVFQIPAVKSNGKSNKRLISKVQGGTVKIADLFAGETIQLGLIADDYPVSCPDNGQGCADLYAVSVAGVTPSAYITWFQAQQACFNARKRLPSNAEWQGAVSGTPDPGPDNGTTDCRTTGSFPVVNGTRSSCVSRWGAFDMVGNVEEWVADWVPLSTTSGTWFGSGDYQGLAGAATTGAPGALLRGGSFDGFGDGTSAGPLTVDGSVSPSNLGYFIGFRCAR
jgi:formylglycine-generating enzyme required for sulfatase activity